MTHCAQELPNRPAYLKPTAPPDLDAQLEWALSSGLRQDQARLAVASYFFREWRLAPEWGFLSQADYVRERLGESQSTFCDWAYAGRLLAHSSRCRAAFRRGGVTLSALALLGQRLSVSAAESWIATAGEVSVVRLREMLRARAAEPNGHAEPDPDSTPHAGPLLDPDPSVRYAVTLRFQLPESAAHYCEQTIELARAVSGAELSQSDALATIFAEASTEIPPAEPGSCPVPPEFLPACQPRARHRSTGLTPPESPILRPAKQRRTRARYLDRRMRGCRRRLAQVAARGDQLLLLAFESHWHHANGYANFYQFARSRFGLARSTAAERLQAARLRRRQHPIAVARAEGRIGTVQSYLLRALEKLGVARTALRAWIEYASRTTVRMLRRCLQWARRISRTHQREWALHDYAPPSFAEVRTSERSLTDLAKDSTPPRRALDSPEPQTRVQWTLDAPDHAFLLDLVAGLDQQVRSMVGPRPDPAWTLLHIFHLARHAWRDTARAMPRHPHREVLERDHYRCQVPGCSRRAVEVHHIVFRSHGGADDASNLICLCPEHHRRGVHDDRLRVTGRVTEDRRELRFDLGVGPTGHPLLSYVGETRV